MKRPNEITNKDLVLMLDEQVNRLEMAAAYIRSVAVNLEDREDITPLVLRLKSHATQLAGVATDLAEKTGKVLPAEIDRDMMIEEIPDEDDAPDVLYKVWVEIERIDNRDDKYENVEVVGPKAIGTFTTLRQAIEQCMSIQGIYGGVQLYPGDENVLEQAEQIERVYAGEEEGMADGAFGDLIQSDLTGDMDSDIAQPPEDPQVEPIPVSPEDQE